MNIFYYSFVILLLLSSPGFAEPLVHIEKKLATRISDVEENKTQVTAITGSPPATEISQYTSYPPSNGGTDLSVTIENRTISSEYLQHPFSVQVGSSRSAKLCYRVALMLRKLGYPAFNSTLHLQNRGIWYRVYIGSFATRDSAQNVKEQLLSENITEGFIRHLAYAVQVGSSGSFKQLETLHERMLSHSLLPYSTPIRNASSGQIEDRLLIGACYERDDCNLLLSETTANGFSAVIVER